MAGAGARLQHGFGQREVIGVGDLEVPGTALHQQRLQAGELNRAGFVGDGPGGTLQAVLQRLQQQAEAEHLRCLGQPLVSARDGGLHPGIGILLLEGIRQRQGQQAADGIIDAGRDELADLRRGQQTARSIVDQHPLGIASGLQLVRYTSEARLNEIMDTFRAHDVRINNPHVYVVEDGKANNQLDPALLQTKAELDPFNLLNPGKLRSAALPACVKAAGVA